MNNFIETYYRWLAGGRGFKCGVCRFRVFGRCLFRHLPGAARLLVVVDTLGSILTDHQRKVGCDKGPLFVRAGAWIRFSISHAPMLQSPRAEGHNTL